MFGGPLFGRMGMNSMFSDPFFGDIGGQMRQMEDMHSRMMAGMLGFQRSPQAALEYGGREHHGYHGGDVVPRRVPQSDPFGIGIFGHMNSLMSDMGQMTQRIQSDPNNHFYSSSTMMSFTNDGSGQPKVYQASSSTRQAPGGVRETRRMMRDSESGMEKMSVGHHIRDRGHVIQRQRNARTGDQEQNEDYLNLDEEEAPAFENEWQTSMHQYAPRGPQRAAVADARSRTAKNRPSKGAMKKVTF